VLLRIEVDASGQTPESPPVFTWAFSSHVTLRPISTAYSPGFDAQYTMVCSDTAYVLP
jgi:hypothetical protein